MKPAAKTIAPWQIYTAGAVVCVAMSLGSYLLAMQPAAEQTREQRAKQDELQSRRRKAAQLNGSYNATKRELQLARATLANMPLRLESASQVNQRLDTLNAAANLSGLTVNEIRPGTLAEGADYHTLPIVIAGRGSYPSCAAFLRRMRQDFPDTAVSSFSAAAELAIQGAPTATFQFHLAWHTAK